MRAGDDVLDGLMRTMGDEFVAWSRSPRTIARRAGRACAAAARSRAASRGARRACATPRVRRGDARGAGRALLRRRRRRARPRRSGPERADAPSSDRIASSVAAAAPIAHVLREAPSTAFSCSPARAWSAWTLRCWSRSGARRSSRRRLATARCSRRSTPWDGSSPSRAMTSARYSAAVDRRGGGGDGAVVRAARDRRLPRRRAARGELVGRQRLDRLHRREHRRGARRRGGIEAAWVDAVEKAAMLDELARSMHRVRGGANEPTTAPELDPFGAERFDDEDTDG